MKDFDRILPKVVLVLTAFLVLIVVTPAYPDKIKKALKTLNKGEFEKTKKILDKSISKKNINPGSKYVYSLYFFRRDNNAYNLDSSYYYILSSIEEFQKVEEKEKKKLKKLLINDSTLGLQKARVEESAFQIASRENSEEQYIQFIQQFPTAEQAGEAITRRDRLAFDKASAINSSKSYQDFLKKYPQSALTEKAKESYDLKLFQEATGTGTLKEYVSFLERNPESPYKKRAEERVFKILTVSNTKESFENFLKTYPTSEYKNQALNVLFYHYLEEKNLGEFIKKYPENPYLAKAQNLLPRQDSIYYVFFDNNRFGLVNELGGQLAKSRFQGLYEEYLCSGVEAEYIIFQEAGKYGAVDKTGIQILRPEFSEIEKFGSGVLKAVKDSTSSLYLMDGTKLLKEEYEEIQGLNNAFAKVKRNNFWGIISLNGTEILKPEFEAISFVEKDFFIVKQKSKYAIVTSKQLEQFAQNGKDSLDFRYESFDEKDVNFLEVKMAGKVGILDSTLNIILPLNYSSITKTKKTWLARSKEGIEIFNSKGSPVSSVVFNKVVQGKEVFAVKYGNKWGIINDAGLSLLPVERDSVVILGDKISLVYQNGKVSGFFNLNQEIPLPEFKKFEVQNTLANNSTIRKQFLVFEGKGGEVLLFNEKGRPILKSKYDKVSVVTENLFVVEEKGKTGVVDSTGKVLLPLKYDGVGNFNEGYFSVLKSSKFGVFNPTNKLLIQPKYDALLKVFDAERKIFLALNEGNYAFMDEKGKLLSDHKFKEASRWKGDTALVKEGSQYYLYSLAKKEKVSDTFQSIKFIKDTQEERLALIYNGTHYGVISNFKEQVVPMKYNDITNLGTPQRPFYMAEHQVEEADLYVVLYFNYNGKLVMSQAYKSDDYEKVLCQE